MSRGRATREIYDKKSTLGRLIVCVDKLSQSGPDLNGLDTIIKDMIAKECAFYKPSEGSIFTCSSGELTGKPEVFGGCALCMISQFDKMGRYIGPKT